ncbi:alpha/beta fold hydrolase [Azospirillum thermophilum]|uniref:Alpha/beta hydrolase n=1 Tax=Azospirillum thermophilum TaxID=2202148 RepID=A0A2S2CUG4_9PROT|nr:alpha/beta hydrolase [Azospirillum thermophilum]AWK88109.1 alpha/beta hydrolase [Azospirillum thermophilum]
MKTIHLHVLKAGPADGTPVILLHGFPEFSHGWRNQIGPLAGAGFRVLAPDQRGYNLSDKPQRIADYRIGQLTGDILRLADAEGWERFHLVGHDWGGIVAWWIGLMHPYRLDRLVVLNAPHPATLRPHMARHPAQLLKSWYVGLFQLPVLPERLIRAGGFRMAERALCATSRRGTFSADELARYREAWGRPGALTAMLNWYRALRRNPRPPAVGIPVPTLILWGDRDAFLDSSLADEAAALCDDARVVHLPRATHWVQHEEADTVNRLLIDFLGGRG